jgi:hypothetical protein
MSTTEFPKTTIKPSTESSSSAHRVVEVRYHADPPPRGETYPPNVCAAMIASYSRDGGAFPPPRVHFANGRAEVHSFTRAEWERLKRDVDRAFDAYEGEWPVDAPSVDAAAPAPELAPPTDPRLERKAPKSKGPNPR